MMVVSLAEAADNETSAVSKLERIAELKTMIKKLFDSLVAFTPVLDSANATMDEFIREVRSEIKKYQL
ncbi:MAG: hypothetical protein ABSC55_11850 [Syntrophorhabdales bacterium]